MSADRAAPDEHDPLIAALLEVLDANRSLQGVLHGSEARILHYIAELRSGRRTADLVRSTATEAVRNEDNHGFERLTRARRQSRAATFRRLIDEGMSRREIAENWGFSQQVVSRILRQQ
jgi:DNA invertase Pin-like site-specific DNA recombinase